MNGPGRALPEGTERPILVGVPGGVEYRPFSDGMEARLVAAGRNGCDLDRLAHVASFEIVGGLPADRGSSRSAYGLVLALLADATGSPGEAARLSAEIVEELRPFRRYHGREMAAAETRVRLSEAEACVRLWNETVAEWEAREAGGASTDAAERHTRALILRADALERRNAAEGEHREAEERAAAERGRDGALLACLGRWDEPEWHREVCEGVAGPAQEAGAVPGPSPGASSVPRSSAASWPAPPSSAEPEG